MIYKPIKKLQLMKPNFDNTKYKNVNEWAMCNGYIQCAGCKGYGNQDDTLWKTSPSFNIATPYCTKECYEGDEQ